MNALRNKWQLTTDDWTQEIDSNFHSLNHLLFDQARTVRHFSIPSDQEGKGEFVHHIDWSKWGMAGVLYQCQHSPYIPVFIGTVGGKCTKYESN